jgi:hypothetical protein
MSISPSTRMIVQRPDTLLPTETDAALDHRGSMSNTVAKPRPSGCCIVTPDLDAYHHARWRGPGH